MVFQDQSSDFIIGQSKNECCGVVAFKADIDVSRYLYFGLRAIQHRGQESVGMAVFTGKSIKDMKGMGMVSYVFRKNNFNDLKGSSGIGHVRYSTMGSSCIDNAQPILLHTFFSDIAIAHNGEIINADEVQLELEKRGAAFTKESDSEVILRAIIGQLREKGDIIPGLKKVMKMIKGSYSLVLLLGDRVFGIRDPLGIKPLCIGKVEGGFGIASESVVFDTVNGEFLRDVKPGEIVELKKDEVLSYGRVSNNIIAHCMFEYVYFSRPDSILDGKCVYEVRRNIGKMLAKEQPVKADVVVPVPDSGRAHALGFSEESNIPFSEGLMKNRYDERTFIMPNHDDRLDAIRLKLNPIKSAIEGKRIVLVDDSIVRGNTMKKIIDMLWHANPKEIHVRICCPPLIAPCYLGIDMKTRDQFIALDRSFEEIAKILNVNSVGYVSVEGLVEAIGIPESDLCLGCVTSSYPIPVKGESYKYQSEIDEFVEKD